MRADGSSLETAGLPQRQMGGGGGGPAGLGGPGLGAGVAPNFVENLLAVRISLIPCIMWLWGMAFWGGRGPQFCGEPAGGQCCVV